MAAEGNRAAVRRFFGEARYAATRRVLGTEARRARWPPTPDAGRPAPGARRPAAGAAGQRRAGTLARPAATTSDQHLHGGPRR